MASEPSVPNATKLLRSAAIFHELSDDQLAEIWSRTKIHNLLRGERLVRQGTESRSVYVVVSGRFEVWIEGQKSAINEIGVGEPIGEIGFFAGVPRTAWPRGGAAGCSFRTSRAWAADRSLGPDGGRATPYLPCSLGGGRHQRL